MTFEDVIKIAAAILLSFGGGSIIVFAFSSWLGKVWANRIMERERAKFEKGLAELRSKFENDNQETLGKLHADLEIYRDTYLKPHNDTIGTYGYVFGVGADFRADLDMIRLGKKPEGDVYNRFNRGRLKAHGYPAMLAPQNVMDAWDAFTAHIFFTLEKASHKIITRIGWRCVDLLTL